MTNDSRLRKIGNKVLDAGAADLEEYCLFSRRYSNFDTSSSGT